MIKAMHKAFLLFCLLFLVGCWDELSPATSSIEHIASDSSYHQMVETTIGVWNDNLFLPPSAHKCKTNNLYFSFANDTDFKFFSPYCSMPPEGQTCAEYWASENVSCQNGCAASFLYVAHEGVIQSLHKKRYVIFISDRINEYSNSEEQITNAIVHESIHWLSFCTGHDRTMDYIYDDGGVRTQFYNVPYIGGDANHADPRLWTGPDSVIQRTLLELN